MSHRKFHGFICAVVAMVLMGTLAAPAWGWESKNWAGGSGDWNNSQNWSPSVVPGSDDFTYIDNGGTANIDSNDNVNVYGFEVGYYHTGSVVQSGGTINTEPYGLTLGREPGARGTYTLSGGSLGAPSEGIGTEMGTGLFIQSGGTNTTHYLFLAVGDTSHGTYLLSGGSLDVYSQDGNDGWLNIPSDETGTAFFDVTGGTVRVDGVMAIHQNFVHVGKDASVTVKYLNIGGEDEPATLQLDLSSTKSSCIYSIGGTDNGVQQDPNNEGPDRLDLQTGTYRPNQGDKFHLMVGFNSISGTFDTITSNLANSDPNVNVRGLLVRDPNATDPNLKYWPAFHGQVEANNGAYDYVVVFQGAMAGDATADNVVNGNDFGALARNWMQSGKIWTDGDFNGDGTVDGTDFGALARNWGLTGLSPAAAPPEEPIPEPAALALLAMGGLALLRGKRRFGG